MDSRKSSNDDGSTTPAAVASGGACVPPHSPTGAAGAALDRPLWYSTAGPETIDNKNTASEGREWHLTRYLCLRHNGAQTVGAICGALMH